MIRLLSFTLLFLGCFGATAQDFQQYFDGADTLGNWNVQLYQIDTTEGNVWQVGSPQKTIFNAADTEPNALITDTINGYPVNNQSSVTFDVVNDWGNWAIVAYQWKQKFDFQHGSDGGVVEFSLDGGLTWQNTFFNPNVYNFYGFDETKVMPISTGEYAFSGTDTTWQDVWLCYDLSWLSTQPELRIRFRLVSDNFDEPHEGWMIDNFLAHVTFQHTAVDPENVEPMRVYPTITDGIVHIEAPKIEGFHIIEDIQVFDITGKLVKSYGVSPTHFWINISDQPDGVYFLRVNTNLASVTHQVVLSK